MTTTIIDLNYKKIKNFLRKHSANIADDYQLRLSLLKLFYYDINNIPIAKFKPENEINYSEYPSYFKNKNRLEIIDIYNKEVKSKSPLKIYTQDELNDYDIKNNNYLEISLKTFRPIYNENWKKISEEKNEVSFDKQKSFYADYLKCFLKLSYFPSFNDYIKFIYNKYKMPLHKDIKIVFDNIENSYEIVKEHIKNNNIDYKEIKNKIKFSTSIPNRILLEKL